MQEENKTNSPPTYVEALERLTPREVDIIKRVKKGETSHEIAKNLGISSRTVHTQA